MASNNTLFLALLVAISAFMAAPSSVEAQIIPRLTSIIVNGTVSCAVNATLSANGTGLISLPPFPNASVQLRCGNTILATTTTNTSGIFRFVITAAQNVLLILSSLLSGGSNNCRLIVTTPLARCNATLPNFGNLVANLTQLPVVSTLPIIGSNNIINILPTIFRFVPILNF